MTEISRPWNGTILGDSGPYSDANWQELYRAIVGFGAGRSNNGVILMSGTEPNNGLKVEAQSPATTSVNVLRGAALVQGIAYLSDATQAFAIAANASGNPRIDTIILRKSWAAQTVRQAILQGTPAASPVPPTLTQTDGVTWEIPLADIAVANGFVSILAANITSRAIGTDMADGVYLDRINNATAAVNQTGDVLRMVSARNTALGTAAGQNLVAGAWVGRTANTANGRILNRGIGYIRTSAAVTAGQFGRLSATARAVDPFSAPVANTVCVFLENTTGAGLALAYIDANMFGDNFAPLIATNRLAAPAASLDTQATLFPSDSASFVVEFCLRSAVVAVSDTVNMRFAETGTPLDTTAADYYSYNANISTAVPVLGAVQNLGATAGIQFTIVGANAPANVFTHGIISIGLANTPGFAADKIITGNAFVQFGNANGNLAVNFIGGRWLQNLSLERINIITNGGSNFATGSYMNVYQKLVI